MALTPAASGRNQELMRLVTSLRLTSPRPALAAAAAILTVGLGAGPVGAATTWTVTPGGRFTSHAGTTKLKDTANGNSLNCAGSSLSGRFKSGSGQSGADIGSVTSGGRFTGCTGPLPFPYSITLRGLPWHISVASDHSDVVHGTISHIEITASLPAGCLFTLDGTAAGAFDCMAQFTYSNSAHTLKLLPTGTNLHFYKVSKCAGIVHSGDSAAYLASYTLSPGQTITGP
jgi:hypothetical protein